MTSDRAVGGPPAFEMLCVTMWGFQNYVTVVDLDGCAAPVRSQARSGACRCAWSTWAPAQQDIAFIARHQVQEAAVHHWDAVHTAGGDLTIAHPVADDAIEELLMFSMSSMADPAEPVRRGIGWSVRSANQRLRRLMDDP